MSDKFCFVKDDNCHWYLIPYTDITRFKELESDDDYITFCDEFDHRRVDSPTYYVFDYPDDMYTYKQSIQNENQDNHG